MSDISPVPEEEVSSYNFSELLNVLYQHKEVLVTIPSEQLTELKDGLQAKKSRDNYALRKKGGQPPSEMLDFLDYPSKDSAGAAIEGQTVVRIMLKPRKAIDIISIQLPDDSI